MAQTKSGTAYAPANYAEKVTAYAFDETMEFRFDTPVGTDFNRFLLTYSSFNIVEGTILYTCDGETVEDVFYLEAGQNRVFRSFITEYLKGKTASGVTAVKIRRKKDGDELFELVDLTFEKAALPEADEVYVQNGRFKLGIRLGWGGGVSCVEDLTHKEEGVTNLLNRHDTGRLVQQSYYGTSKPPYVPAKFWGNTWSYNPVQGGDQYNNRSRLIDWKRSEDGLSLYIKCRPADWAQNGLLTFSYMENTYTVEDTFIKVDNRFIDFSGFQNGRSHQEIPAFYTISYLSDFCFYDGENAWSDEPFTRLPDEPFWGDSGKCYHKMKSAETWGAWVSRDGWGIGEYTPIATTLLAGRYKFDGDKSADGDPTNYVAPLMTRAMTTYEPFSYSYYITTGTAEEIRAEFKKIYEKNSGK